MDDHCKATDFIIRHVRIGEVYNVSGHNEKANIDVVKMFLRELGKLESLITYVTDRKSHDQRYAIDPTKIHEEISFINGWIDKYKLPESAETYGKNPYGAHLKAVADRKVRY